ncbi:hypothetical protein TYRP_020276 [Tyrophagus putrescentiae]|nr:hypothetical protein TYRP_020276 [Tyrophagus putrescentiae]
MGVVTTLVDRAVVGGAVGVVGGGDGGRRKDVIVVIEQIRRGDVLLVTSRAENAVRPITAVSNQIRLLNRTSPRGIAENLRLLVDAVEAEHREVVRRNGSGRGGGRLVAVVGRLTILTPTAAVDKAVQRSALQKLRHRRSCNPAAISITATASKLLRTAQRAAEALRANEDQRDEDKGEDEADEDADNPSRQLHPTPIAGGAPEQRGGGGEDGDGEVLRPGAGPVLRPADVHQSLDGADKGGVGARWPGHLHGGAEHLRLTGKVVEVEAVPHEAGEAEGQLAGGRNRLADKLQTGKWRKSLGADRRNVIAIEKKASKICGVRQRLHRHRRQEVFAQVQLHQVGQLHKGVIGDGAQLTTGQKELLQVDETALLEGPRRQNLKVVGVQVEHLRRG